MLLDLLKITIALTSGAGLWRLYELYKGRTYQSTLTIDIKTTSSALGEYRRILFVDVQLTNVGRGKIEAKPIKADQPGQYAYKDKLETILYSGSLQIRQVQASSVKGNEHLDWFKSGAVQPVSGIPEVNLLDEYIRTDRENEIEFWLEPGETVHLNASLAVAPGHYFLKVSFYGPHSDEDFWHRLVYVQVE